MERAPIAEPEIAEKVRRSEATSLLWPALGNMLATRNTLRRQLLT
jgi:hypothetical protein